jgi:DNA polymerase III alpha subunit
METNKYGDCIFNDDDILDLIYQNPELDISNLFVVNPTKYNDSLKMLGLCDPKLRTVPKRGSVEEFDQINIDNWHMPEKYYQINVLEWLLERCQNDEERLRVQMEYDLFEKKKFVRVLQFLIYFVDTLRANNIVWGVGRGSSVASFCLFLIGVHKINPLLYNLDITEFLR